jgi:hypothetical protein
MYAVRIIPQIDWDQIIQDLNMDPTQNNDPDELVHELAHMYLARKELAFKFHPTDPSCDSKFVKYNQNYVAKIIKERFKTDYSRDKNEIESAAVTYLVLQPLGQTDLLLNIKTMRGNLSFSYFKELGNNPESVKKANNDFLFALENKKVIEAARKITDFILKYFIK